MSSNDLWLVKMIFLSHIIQTVDNDNEEVNSGRNTRILQDDAAQKTEIVRSDMTDQKAVRERFDADGRLDSFSVEDREGVST